VSLEVRREIGDYLAGLLPDAEIDAMLERRQCLLDAYQLGDSPTQTEVREFAHDLAELAADNRELRRRIGLVIFVLTGHPSPAGTAPPPSAPPGVIPGGGGASP
jgi:hypothetical protein